MPRTSRSRLLAHCLSPHYVRERAKTKVRCGGGRGGGGGGGGDGAGGGRRGSHRDFLFASFVIPLISLPDRAAANGRRCLLSPFSSSFTSSLARIPSPGCNSGGLSAPRTAVYFYCDVLPPPPHSLLLAPYSHLPPFPATSTTAPRARLLFIRVAPAFFFLFFSFLLSFCAAPRVARGQ